MGVLQCDRTGCENVPCELHANGHGYICNSCFEELVQKLVSTDGFQWDNQTIREFMNSDKREMHRVDIEAEARMYLDSVFTRL